MSRSWSTRLISFLLALVTLLGTVGITSFADDASADTTVGDVGNLADVIKASTYETYMSKYGNEKTGANKIAVNVLDYSKELTTAKDVVVYEEGVKYDGYNGGKAAIYLPTEGAVGWKFTVPEGQGGLYCINILYYAETTNDSKQTSIERSLYIDQTIPFYEATYLSFTKTYVCDYKTKDYVDSWLANEKVDKKFEHYDASGKYAFQPDINGNEIRPAAIMQPTWRNKTFSDPTGYYVQPLQFYFSEGEHTIQLYAQREDMAIASMELVPYEKDISYDDYVAGLKADGAKVIDNLTANIRYEAEFTTATSEATIYATSDRTSCITSPQHPSAQALNTLGGGTDDKRWNTVGQWVRYEVEVPEDGFYKIALRYNQNTLQGSFVSRQLRVQLAGEEYATVPFDEASYLQFKYADDWQTGYLTDGAEGHEDGLLIYFKKGVNYIELEANLGDMAEIIRTVDNSLDSINNAYIKILMICGTSPDENTSYGFYRRIPEAVDELYNQSVVLNEVIAQLKNMSKDTGSQITTLETVANLLEKMGKDENEIAGNLDELKGYLGTLGTWINDSRESPLELDYIEITNGTDTAKDAPKALANFWETIVFEFRMFIASFTADYDTLGQLSKTDGTSIEVWVTTARDQTQIVRNLVNNEFTPKYNIGVDLKLVAGGSLLPSVLAGVGPDVSVGHGSGDVINWAIRSALVELTDFVENDKEIQTWFSDAAWIPLELHEVITIEKYNELSESEKAKYSNYVVMTKEQYEALDAESDEKIKYQQNTDGNYAFDENGNLIDKNYMQKYSIWGVPTEQTFYMMFYRADVFADLGIDPPETWDDLEGVIGVLQANNMEIAMPTSLEGLKLFLYQMGGDLYSNGGQTINIDSNVAISAFESLSMFFQQYRFPISYAFSTRFRTGEMPLGIVSYTTYTELSVLATEIKGLWEFVPLPGMITGYDANGNAIVNNTSISGTSALIMLNDAKDVDKNGNPTEDDKTEEAWQFMKWFTSKEAQASYASELTAVLGTVSKHPTANQQALMSLPWTTSEVNNIKEQFKNLSAVREYPGGYIIGRYIEFSFLEVYNENADPVESLLKYVVTINVELTRKREEFGLATMDPAKSDDE